MAQTSYSISFGPRFDRRTAPVTYWYLVAALVIWVLGFLAPGAGLGEALAFRADSWTQRPWTLVVYPLHWVGMHPLNVLMLGYVLWWSAGDNEMWWGPRVQAGFFVAMAAGMALALALGGAAFGEGATASGPGALISGSLTIWCLRHLEAQILLLFVPVTGRLLLGLEILVLWWSYGPALGVCAVLGCPGLAVAYFYWGHHLHQIPRRLGLDAGSRQARQVRRQKTERDRRVREIFERSGLHVVDDDEKGSRG
jgi:hypothetical protein